MVVVFVGYVSRVLKKLQRHKERNIDLVL